MPEGQVYAEFQSYCKALKSIGVILAVDSKNDEANALAGLNHPDGVLRPDDFVAIKANWEPKDLNLKAIASELNLGADSFVFADDNPAERAIVAAQVPGAAVPALDGAENYIKTLDHGGYFEVTALSKEDLKKTELYHQNAERAKAQAAFTDYGQYLDSLEMTATVKGFEPLYIQRIAQLTNKSNQFNLTTLRCSEDDIRAMAEDKNYLCLCGKLVDKFGDNGIVTVVAGQKQGDALHMRLWLMSCRVLKRGMEDALMDTVVAEAAARGQDHRGLLLSNRKKRYGARILRTVRLYQNHRGRRRQHDVDTGRRRLYAEAPAYEDRAVNHFIAKRPQTSCPGAFCLLDLFEPLIRPEKFKHFAAAQHAAGDFLGVARHKNALVGDIRRVDRRAVGQHPGVDQLVQHADRQRGDVLGAQVVQNQQVGLLTGGQPLVIVGIVEVLAPQLGGQRGGARVQHVVAALQHSIGNRQRQMCFAKAGVPHKQQIRAVLAEPRGVVAAVVQQLAHILLRRDAQLGLDSVAVALDLKARKLAQPQRAGGVDLLAAQAAGNLGYAAAGVAALHAGVAAQRAVVARREGLGIVPGVPRGGGQRFVGAQQGGAGGFHAAAQCGGFASPSPARMWALSASAKAGWAA